MDNLFGECIFSYSCKEAIEDGVLVDLMQNELGNLVCEAGFKVPIVMTSEAFNKYVFPLEGDLPSCQSINGRIWDILTMLRLAIRGNQNSSTIKFSFYCIVRSEKTGKWLQSPKLCVLKSMIHAGDNGEPVMTIMMPNED